MHVSELLDHIPHRGAAIWIDEVISFSDETGGKCKVTLNDGHSLTQNNLRESSYIEFMAQSFGFVSAAQKVKGLLPNKKIAQAFLVGVKNFKVLAQVPPTKGDTLFIEVHRTHELGEISIIEGKITNKQGSILAQGQIKLFARVVPGD